MYYIKDIEHISKYKRKVYLDNGLVFPLTASEEAKLNIKSGMELSEEEYEEIYHKILIKAEKYLLGLLTDSDRTKQELYTKLKNAGYPKEISEKALSYVESYGYVDDENYARKYVDYHSRSSSQRVIRQKLMLKGINKEILDKVFSEAEIDERPQIERFLKQKYIDKGLDPKDPKIRDKAVRSLMGKGFSYSEIKDVMGLFWDS